MHPRHDCREEEEQAVHNAKRKARLQHATRPVDVQMQRIERRAPQNPQANGRRRPRRDADAVKVLDKAQVVHARDKGTDESEIDETDEARVGAGAVVREEGEERPGEAEHGDDEEDEDVAGRE